jgi:hypothetical protein
MKPLAQVLMTVVLVAAGIVLYDTVVVERRGASPDAVPPTTERERAQEVDEPAPFPLLQGRGDDAWRADLEHRIEVLEAGLARAGPAKHPGSAAPDGGGSPQAGPSPEGPGPDGASPSTGSSDEPWMDAEGAKYDAEGRRIVTPKELTRFRKMLEAVEHQRQREKAARAVSQFLDKIGVKLTDDERKAVIGTTLDYQGKWRQASGSFGKDDEGNQKRTEAHAALVRDYEQALRAVAPGSEVDLMMDAMRRARQDAKK